MKMSKLDFPLYGSSVDIVTKFGCALSDIIDSKFGCVATFHDVDFEAGGRTAKWRKPTPITPKKICEFVLPEVKVSVWKADLTHFKADVVVNAANERLQHCGGLAQALSAAGGPQIQQESDDYIKRRGPLRTGDAVALGAGNLPYKMIIHAVGPDLPSNPSYKEVQNAKPLLETAIRHIFDRAEDCHVANVAIPAISSGLFHYPLHQCAETIVSSVKKVYEKASYRKSLPKEVFFVNNDEPTVTEMEWACRQILAPHQTVMFSQPVTTSQPVTHNQGPTYNQAFTHNQAPTYNQSPTYNQAFTHNQAPTYNQAFIHNQAPTYSSAASRNTRGAAKTSPPVQIQIGNILLTLKKDKIEEQRTDVIVNTASEGRDLNMGQISKAILHKAGQEMQKEINNAKMEGHLIRTKPYRLRCKEVYHTFCIGKWSNPAASQILFRSVLECLWTAGTSNHNSIAFPAIGTGVLGFSKTESAQIMLDAVVDFSQKFQKLEVFFVIFPSDHSTFQAFESQIGQYQQKVTQHGAPPGDYFQGLEDPSTLLQQRASDHSSTLADVGRTEQRHVSRAPKPQIVLCGPSEESTLEAGKWLRDLLNETPRHVEIVSNFLMHLSEQDHLKLSLLTEEGVHIEEFLSKGHSCLTLDGDSKEDVVVAALKVEEILCNVQKEFVSEEKREMQLLSGTKVSFDRQEDLLDLKYKRAFKDQGLRITKVDRVKNRVLEVLFDMKKNQLGCSRSQTMFQRIPAQFCEMISHIGFHAECAPPEDQMYGKGIYFAHTVRKAMELWKENHDEFLYFVLAEVLTGQSVPGKPEFILPPVRQAPDIMYDSVTGGPDVSVIFSGYQALPKFIFICRKESSVL